jgi:Plasmid pRiA4b ORF-3-like protein
MAITMTRSGTRAVGSLSTNCRLVFAFAAQSLPALGKGWKSMSTSKRTPAQPSSIHQLKVTLMDFQPSIWRRIGVPSDITLADLHAVVQLAMGWHFSHLHDFRVGKVTYGDPDMLVDPGDRDERRASLVEIAPKPKKRFRYLYDFGDSWEHEIVVEAVGPPAPGTRYPVCLAGEGACPPEDCGGVWGYADLLETIADPENPEYEDMLEWLGGPIDPAAFDLKEVNRRLAKFR